MPKSQRPVAAGAALLLLALLVSACGGRAANGDGRQSVVPTAAATVRPSSAAGSAVPGPGGSAQPSGAPAAAGAINGCTAAALNRCDYGPGNASVTAKVITVTDASTGRKLPVRVHIPAGAGPFPVVLYSHGGGLDDNGYNVGQAWAEAVAPQGYIVGAIAHASMTAAEGLAMCAAASIPKAECLPGEEDSGMIGYLKMRDVVSIIDALPALVQSASVAADTSRIAVMGWSAGSRATVATRGTSWYPSNGAPLFSRVDARVGVIAAFSPTGPGFGGFFETGTTSSWSTLKGPTFMATGDNDVKPDKPDLTGPIRRKAFELQPADGSRQLLYSRLPVGVGGHGTFNLDGLVSSDERLSRYSRALASAVRAVFDANLKGSAAARAWLASDNARILGGQVDWVTK